MLKFTHEDMDYTQVENDYVLKEEGYIKPRMGYMKTNKVTIQAKAGYVHKTMSYTTDGPTFCASLYQSARIHGA